MNSRAQAIAVLREARELLLRRLTEAVLDARDEILDDAHGNSYTSSIESLQDQIGSRLSNVNALLSNLQSGDDDSALDFAPEPALAAATVDATAFVQATTEVPSGYDTLIELIDEDPVEPITFETFARQIQRGDAESASASLAALFEVEPALAERCARTFLEHWRKSDDILQKALRLRLELQCGSTNGSLMLLWECFGLQGIESVRVLETLKSRLGA